MWTAFCIGLFIGCFLGVIILGLCVAAKKNDDFMPGIEDLPDDWEVGAK